MLIIEASLASAEVSAGAVAKADQYSLNCNFNGDIVLTLKLAQILWSDGVFEPKGSVTVYTQIRP